MEGLLSTGPTPSSLRWYCHPLPFYMPTHGPVKKFVDPSNWYRYKYTFLSMWWSDCDFLKKQIEQNIIWKTLVSHPGLINTQCRNGLRMYNQIFFLNMDINSYNKTIASMAPSTGFTTIIKQKPDILKVDFLRGQNFSLENWSKKKSHNMCETLRN